MKILRFNPAEGLTKLIPNKFTEEHVEVSQGVWKKKIIVHTYKAVKDESQINILKVFTKDLNDFASALVWRIEMDDLNLPFTSPGKDEITSIQIAGQFDPQISPDDISIIVKDYELLAQKFPTYSDIFRHTLSPVVTEAVLNHLLTLSKGEESRLPEWISRVLELRKNNK